MVLGVKSKYFGCYWQSMFLSAMVYPSKINEKEPTHLKKMKEYKKFYGSFKYVLGCKFCREFVRDVLEKEHPIDFSGRIPLMKSIYTWKSEVNRKLIAQGCKVTKQSPPFKDILKRYEKLRARCNKSVGKCV